MLAPFAQTCCSTAESVGVSVTAVIDTGAQNCVIFTDKETVLRFPRFEPFRVQEVAERHQAVKDLGLPAPEIVGVREGSAGMAHVVLEAVPGSPFLEALPSLDKGARERATDELVDLLLHARSIEGSRWPFFSHPWTGMWSDLYEKLSRDSPIVTSTDIDNTRDALTAANTAPLGLIHGDLAWGNILFASTGALTTVLDWDFAVIADPAIDTSAILLNLPADMAKRFHDGHGEAAADMDRVQHYLGTWDLQHRMWQAQE